MSFTIAEMLEATPMSVNGWMGGKYGICLSQQNGILLSCKKKTKVLIHCTMWIYRENTKLNERIETEKVKHVGFHLHEMFRIDKSV